jgi:hypothetical protein
VVAQRTASRATSLEDHRPDIPDVHGDSPIHRVLTVSSLIKPDHSRSVIFNCVQEQLIFDKRKGLITSDAQTNEGVWPETVDGSYDIIRGSRAKRQHDGSGPRRPRISG